MKKLASLKKNLGFQTAYQISNLCVPIITAPYLARALGAEQLGVFSYTDSIIQYFILFSMLGVITYGTRSIAAVRDCKEKVREVFSSIFGMQCLTALTISIFYIIYLYFFCKNNLPISSIQIIYLLNCMCNISWLFFGLEQFKIVLVRNFIVKVLSVICILLFVKERTDLWIYVLIISMSTFLSEIVLWLNLPREYFKIPDINKILIHIKPNILLFIPLLAMSVYHIMDKTMLGALSNSYQSGCYYNADKIINVPICIISGINTVFLPRITALFAQNRVSEANGMFVRSLQLVILIASAIGFGIMSISEEFVPFFFGEGYNECILLLEIMAPILVIKGYALTVRQEFLIPKKLESKYIASVIFGSLVNLIANFLLIPNYGAIGAAYGTIIAESCACIWQYIAIARHISLKNIILKTCRYIFCGIVMYLSVKNLGNYILTSKVSLLVLKILGGASIYAFSVLVCWKIFGDDVIGLSLDTVVKRRLIK